MRPWRPTKRTTAPWTARRADVTWKVTQVRCRVFRVSFEILSVSRGCGSPVVVVVDGATEPAPVRRTESAVGTIAALPVQVNSPGAAAAAPDRHVPSAFCP